MEIQNTISTEINQKYIDVTVEVLVEKKSKKGIENQYWGKTRTNKVVVFSDSQKTN